MSRNYTYTVTFPSDEKAAFVADILRPYGIEQPKREGGQLILSKDALEILAEHGEDNDGCYIDGQIWVSGDGYAVTRNTGRPSVGTSGSTRITATLDADVLARLDQAAYVFSIDRSAAVRRAIEMWLGSLYTVEIQSWSESARAWMALAPAETVSAASARDAAEDVADDQNIAEGPDWRVCAWAGADPDTGGTPDHIFEPES
jgi:predicted transcriptional regulator